MYSIYVKTARVQEKVQKGNFVYTCNNTFYFFRKIQQKKSLLKTKFDMIKIINQQQLK